MNRTTILIVDDIDINREILCEIFKEEYSILEADRGELAMELLHKKKDEICVVLLDVIMPGMNGFEVLGQMKEKGLLSKIPVLLITAETSMDVEKKGYQMGVSDIIRKPFDSYIIEQRVKNIIELYYHKNNLEQQVEEQTKILRKQFMVLKKQAEQLKDTNNRIIDTMSTVVEFRNMESGEHIKRIKGFTRVLAEFAAKYYKEYGLNDEKIEVIVSASSLHDVGKIAIPDNILLKPARLTAEEFEIMKSHTTRGCEILDTITDIQDKTYHEASYEICRHHHERFDGRGYPDGLKGDDIPIAAQIVSVADVYDALVSERVYKAAYTKEEAYRMIQEGECGMFSPKLLECLKMAKDKMEALVDAK